jgi:hypothetical protein
MTNNGLTPSWSCILFFADGSAVERVVTVSDPAQALDIAEDDLGRALAAEIVDSLVEAA